MSKQLIECKTSHKKLACIDENNIYIWCKRCNTEHAFTKQEVLAHWGVSQHQDSEISIQSAHVK
jgi:hypothetical protein